jgi:hypothetical protein
VRVHRPSLEDLAALSHRTGSELPASVSREAAMAAERRLVSLGVLPAE